jgi:hypothetical protein
MALWYEPSSFAVLDHQQQVALASGILTRRA